MKGEFEEEEETQNSQGGEKHYSHCKGVDGVVADGRCVARFEAAKDQRRESERAARPQAFRVAVVFS